MLTFLRKLRRSLIDSGSGRKYIIYAIGEILLVMIGILLALQINNWNQARINNNEESRILRAISKDMSRIHDYCRVCGNSQQQVIEASQRLLVRIQNENYESSESEIQQDIASLLGRCFVGEGLVSNIYDVLMGSDQLELLSSRSLRDKLGFLDSWIGTTIPYEILQAEFVDQQLKPFINDYIDRLPLSIESLEMDPSIDKSYFNSSYSELLSKRKFSNLLIDLMINTKRIAGMYDYIGRSIGDVDSILIKELPSLETEILIRSN